MQELLDRIKERNFGRTIELREYRGSNLVDLKLLDAGINVRSVFVNGNDLGVNVYGFNTNRKPELDEYGDYADEKEVDNIITRMIRRKYD